MKIENGRIIVEEESPYVSLQVEENSGDCPYIHYFDLTPEEAETLANRLLNAAQDVRGQKGE